MGKNHDYKILSMFPQQTFSPTLILSITYVCTKSEGFNLCWGRGHFHGYYLYFKHNIMIIISSYDYGLPLLLTG